MPNQPKRNKQSIPTGVKIISILYYIGAGIFALFAILMLIISLISLFSPSSFQNTQSLPLDSFGPIIGLLGAFALVGGIILLGISLLFFFIARDLWKGKNWARIVVIILAFLGILTAIISMIQGDIPSNIFNLVINLLIGGYLLLSNNVKQAFA